MKLNILPYILLLVIPTLVSCQDEPQEPQFLIGFSQCTTYDAWRKEMGNEMRRELAFHENVDFKFKDASGNNELQILQIKELVAEGVDLLIISPNEAEPITPVVEEAFQRGIPVVLLDRKTSSNLFTAFVGADNYQIGLMAAKYIASDLNGKGNVIEIRGLSGSTPFIERHRGFVQGISEFPGIKVTPIEGDWGVKRDGEAAFLELLEEGHEFDMVFAHNDILAIAAQRVYTSLNNPKYLKIMGVDGLAGPNGGLQEVADGLLHATILYPPGGDKAIQLAMDILNKRSYSKENILKTTVIDSSNVQVMQNYADKIRGMQSDMDRMGSKIDQQLDIFKTQQNLLYTLTALFLVTVLSLIFVLKLLVDRRKIDKRLKRRNEEILRQKDKILEMSEKANRANKEKITFFTNISHEFRTPLTLIQAPIEELLLNKGKETNKNEALLIQKNVKRLLRLVNQLMDFRKIDNAKMPVRASEQNLILFLEDIIAAFGPMAKKSSIQLKLLSDNRNIKLWFDPGMLDKVMFNLLSNAFKYTSKNGRIIIRVMEDELKNEVVIMVEDNGLGMSSEELQYVFDRFYQGKDAYKKMGTGLGLALSKEMVELHHGMINASSTPGEKTAFEIRMKKGKGHFPESEIVHEDVKQHLMEEDAFFYDDTVELETVKVQGNNPKNTILVIEDDSLLRNYFKQKLVPYYEILEAERIEEGLSKAKEHIPDLITCDLMLAGENGLEVIRELKSDIRTSHIPIIVISAKSSLDDRLEGIRLGIDDYITKPFSIHLLLERIKMLLINREKLRTHFVHELPADSSISDATTMERKFMNVFTALIEENIADPKFGANELGAELGLSRSQLYRKVKAVLGYSVNDYINKVRIKKAKRLLLEDDRSIAEIAQAIGFSSSTYFSTVFKNHLGLSPSEFREKQRINK